MSYYERRLLQAIEEKEELEADAAAADPADYPDIERRFRSLAGEFNSIVADNPDQIEVRLIYAKMLDYFGDEIGARDQFAEVLKRDATIAVAHQQLGTHFAEEGDPAKALVYYLNAVQLEPAEAMYHYGVGELLYTFGEELIEEGAASREMRDAQMLEAFREAARLEPGNLAFQFRYGESYYDVFAPDWGAALAHWEWLELREDLDPLQRQALLLHQARCLGELARYAEARKRAEAVREPGLEASRRALIEAIDEAETRDSEA